MELKVKVTADILDMVENYRMERLRGLEERIAEAEYEELETALKSVYKGVENADQAEMLHMYLVNQATEVND